MNRGARRAPIFFDHECCALFHDLLGELPERYGVVLHGYALMPNHFHLLVQTPRANLSRAMRFLCGRYAVELNRTHEWDGPLFKGRFKSRLVESDEYWRHLLAYIHLNPVRGGLVSRLDEADWTSHGAYVGLCYPPAWLHLDEFLDLFGSAEAYYGYLQAVQRGRQQQPLGFTKAVLWKRRARSRLPVDAPEVEPPEDVENAIANALIELQAVTGIGRGGLLRVSRGRIGNRARWLTAWWLRWRDQLTGADVARLLDVSQARVSQMTARARQAAEDDEQLSTWMEQLRETRTRVESG